MLFRSPRLTPFDLAFRPFAAERFPLLRAGLEAAGRNPRSRDEFVLVKDVVELLRDLRPDEGAGEGVGELVALCHAAFLHWLDGESVVAVDRGGPRESQVDGRTGFLVDESPEAFARAMERLADDEGLTRSLGQAAREHSRRYDWKEFVDRIDAALEIGRAHV